MRNRELARPRLIPLSRARSVYAQRETGRGRTDSLSNTGGADAFEKLLETELIPKIESTMRRAFEGSPVVLSSFLRCK